MHQDSIIGFYNKYNLRPDRHCEIDQNKFKEMFKEAEIVGGYKLQRTLVYSLKSIDNHYYFALSSWKELIEAYKKL